MLLMLLASSIERWPLEKLIPYARNARTHSDAQVAQIAAPIKEFGFANPILAATDCVIIAGHGRLLAARKLRMTEVPVIILDGLTENQRRALTLANNKLALNAGWDEEALRLEIEALQDADYDLNPDRIRRRGTGSATRIAGRKRRAEGKASDVRVRTISREALEGYAIGS
jgi:ParB-like chromosome segregation protein Spo0J